MLRRENIILYSTYFYINGLFLLYIVEFYPHEEKSSNSACRKVCINESFEFNNYLEY